MRDAALVDELHERVFGFRPHPPGKSATPRPHQQLDCCETGSQGPARRPAPRVPSSSRTRARSQRRGRSGPLPVPVARSGNTPVRGGLDGARDRANRATAGVLSPYSTTPCARGLAVPTAKSTTLSAHALRFRLHEGLIVSEGDRALPTTTDGQPALHPRPPAGHSASADGESVTAPGELSRGGARPQGGLSTRPPTGRYTRDPRRPPRVSAVTAPSGAQPTVSPRVAVASNRFFAAGPSPPDPSPTPHRAPASLLQSPDGGARAGSAASVPLAAPVSVDASSVRVPPTDGLQSTESAVLIRLFREERVGVTATGRRVWGWATAAGLRLTAWPAALQDTCRRYAADPPSGARRWKRQCARGRLSFARLAVHALVGGQTARSADLSLLSGGVTPHPHARHRDTAAESPRSASSESEDDTDGARGRRRRHGAPRELLTRQPHESLRAFRDRLQYGRWCLWQLHRFFETGPSYLTSVWQLSSAGDVAAFCAGRYVVPTDERIDRAVGAWIHEQQKVKFLRKMLLAELGLLNEKVSAVKGSTSAHDAEDEETAVTAGEATPTASKDSSLASDESAAGARRLSDTLARQEPYVEVRFASGSGLLELFTYVNGTEDGEAATFLSKSVAGCLDNRRWLILEGRWRGQVVHFSPRHRRRVCLTRSQRALCGTRSASASALNASKDTIGSTTDEVFTTVEEPDDMQFMQINGICLEKVRSCDSQATAVNATDLLLCVRCGQLRRRGNNEAALTRPFPAGGQASQSLSRSGDFVLCRVCGTRSRHVHVSPDYWRERCELQRLVATAASREAAVQIAERYLDMMELVPTGGGRRRRPPWVARTHIDGSALDRAPSHAAAPFGFL